MSKPLPFKDWKAKFIAGLGPGKPFMTRRPIKEPSLEYFGEDAAWSYGDGHSGIGWYVYSAEYPEEGGLFIKCPYGGPGDKIWGKEAYRFGEIFDDLKPSECPHNGVLKPRVFYEADGKSSDGWQPNDSIKEEILGRYRHARFMPKWASRISAVIVEVRVERVREISAEDCRAEGVRHYDKEIELVGGIDAPLEIHAFANIWNEFYRDTPYAWERDPHVWALTLRKE